MAALARYGAETGAVPTTTGTSPETGTTRSSTGTVEIDSTKQRPGGRFCAKCVGGAVSYISHGLTATALDRTYFHRFAFRLSALPAANLGVSRFLDTTGTLLELTVSAAGKVELWNPVQAAHLVGETAPTIAAEEWHVINILLRINTAGKGKVAWLMDGVSRAAEQEMTFRNSVILSVREGNVGGLTPSVYIDDVAVNDDQGAAQNTHPSARGRIVLLKPVAQKARTGFTGGGGATTNLHEALDNTPPIGAASPGTNASQIGSANNNTTDNVELTLAKYTDALEAGGAGMGVSDPLLVLWAVMRGGQSSATGRGLGLTMVSNPAVAEKTDGLEAVIAGADPVGWRTASGTWNNFQYAPAITYEQGPVIKLRKSAATTDNVMIDLAGLMVEYEPEVSPQSLKREVADAVTGTDALGPRAFVKQLVEAATGSDIVSRALSKLLMDSATASDGSARAATKRLADGVSGADSVQTFFVLIRKLADTVTATDGLGRFFSKRVGETGTGSDAVKRSTSKLLAETVTGTPNVRQGFSKRLADVVSAIDGLKAKIIQKTGTYLRYLGKWVKVK